MYYMLCCRSHALPGVENKSVTLGFMVPEVTIYCILCVQFLESYKSVTLGSMAAAFGVSVDFMDRELVDFIVAGRLPAKIDKVPWGCTCHLREPSSQRAHHWGARHHTL